jgi:hypothetical protein
LELEQWTNGMTLKRMGTSVQSLKKPTSKGNTFWRAGTAELTPYSNLYYISNIFLPLLRKNGIGNRSAEENLKTLKTTCNAYLGLGLSIYIKNTSIHLVTQSL